MNPVEVILYGAGKRSRNLCKILSGTNVKVIAIVDSDSGKWGNKLEGYQIQSPEILCDFQNVYFCITVADINSEKAIKDKLCEKYHMKKEQEIQYYSLVFEDYKQNAQIKGMIRGCGEGNTEKEILFSCLNGLILGGIEAWTTNICEVLIRNGKEHLSIVFRNGSYDVPHTLKNHIILVDTDSEMRFSFHSIQNVIKTLLRKIPCKIVTSQVDEVFIAACLIKHYLPDMIEIISVIHGGVEKIYEEYIDFKEYVDIYIGVSQDIKSALLQKGLESERVHSITCPFECEQNLIRVYTDDQDMPIRIGYAGRMEYSQKRMDLLLKCIELLTIRNINFYMELAGDGNARQEMEKFVREKKLDKRVKFLGKLERAEIPAFWKRQDICVNIADYEGRSISIIEAMGNGAIPIVTETSGTKEDIIDGINGYRVPIGDYDKMADKIEYLANHRAYLRDMGRLAHDVVYPKSLMEPHLKFWKEILFDDL